MVRTERSPHQLSRLHAQHLADQILSRKPISSIQPTRVSKAIRPTPHFNRRSAEELAAEIFGRNNNFKGERREKRKRHKLAVKRKKQAEEQHEQIPMLGLNIPQWQHPLLS